MFFFQRENLESCGIASKERIDYRKAVNTRSLYIT